ncbi:hypothetical protein [Listeria seeligeri]|uniref:hypothetical protein n=1 Tax=Listeria seeligeri TaxID=1640 RepID=UPI0021AB9886|nr:hypothetical protein [Listeria seeligeri]
MPSHLLLLKVFVAIKDSEGNELDGPQLLAIDDNTSEIKSIEDLIKEKLSD